MSPSSKVSSLKDFQTLKPFFQIPPQRILIFGRGKLDIGTHIRTSVCWTERWPDCLDCLEGRKCCACMAAQPEVQKQCWCPTPPSIPASPRDGRIRISHSTVNLSGLIHHSEVPEWCEQAERECEEEMPKGCFSNIKRNWILCYLTCVVSQAAHGLLMDRCNRIGSPLASPRWG